MTKEEIKEIEIKLIEMTSSFCNQFLDNEYSFLCEKIIKKLGRKRDVPFQRGKPEIWAAAVIHALGTINFLFDKSFLPYATVDDISNYFGTKKNSVSNKSREIREMLNMGYFGSEFSTRKVNESNPFENLAIVDGFIVRVGNTTEKMQSSDDDKRAIGQDNVPENLQSQVKERKPKSQDTELFPE